MAKQTMSRMKESIDKKNHHSNIMCIEAQFPCMDCTFNFDTSNPVNTFGCVRMNLCHMLEDINHNV